MSPRKSSYPPRFANLGRQARDIFKNGFLFGLWNLEVKTKSKDGIELKAIGTANSEGKVGGFLEAKGKRNDLILNEKWNTDRVLFTEIKIKNQGIKGLTVAFDAAFTPQTGQTIKCIKTSFTHPHVQFNAGSIVHLGGTVVNVSAVVSFNRWFTGYRFEYDASKSTITANNFAMEYKCGSFVVYSLLSDTDFSCSIYNKFNVNLATAINFKCNPGEKPNDFGIACKYDTGRNGSFHAKVNNRNEIGFGYKLTLRKGIAFNLSTLVDCSYFNVGKHKIGVGLQIEV